MNIFGFQRSQSESNGYFISNWLSSVKDSIYANIPTLSDIPEITKEYLPNSFSPSVDYVWDNKEWIMGGTAIGAALLLLCRCRGKAKKINATAKPRPTPQPIAAVTTTAQAAIASSAKPPVVSSAQSSATPPITPQQSCVLPQAKITSSLHRARVDVITPDLPKLPLKASILFCVDLSLSMNNKSLLGNDNTRLQDVQEAVTDVKDDAQRMVDQDPTAHFEVALTGFRTDTAVYIPPTALKPRSLASSAQKRTERKTTDETDPCSIIKNTIKSLKADGNTEISQSLIKSVPLLAEMAKRIGEGKHTFILLTDGEQDLNVPQAKQVLDFKAQLKSISGAKFFVIGIGKEHRKELLSNIAAHEEFPGEYIDTSIGTSTIKTAIAAAYAQAKPSFQLGLVSPLQPNQWSVDGQSPQAIQGHYTRSLFKFGAIPKNTQLLKVLEIRWEQLQAPLDLDKLDFTLVVEDPYGRTGEIKLSWNANTRIDPAIMNVKPRQSSTTSSGRSLYEAKTQAGWKLGGSSALTRTG